MISSEILGIEQYLVELRRDLHSNPETAFREFKTADRIAAELENAGLSVRKGIGKTGVVGVLEGAKSGPTLLIRADIDALPIAEQTALSFASTNGAMHACGHDGHIAMAVGAARVLAATREKLNGRVVFAFQPAEEIVHGALAMIEDGVLETPKPDRVVGIHLWNALDLGRVGVNMGTVFASADVIRITVNGRGGHGAAPQDTVDPVVTSAEIVTALQTIVSREISPNDMGVLTFGQINGGSAPNVIPDSVILEGTVRAFKPEIRSTIFKATERVAAAVASSMRAEAHFEHLYGSPPVINNPEVAAFVARHATAVVGEEMVGEVTPTSMGDDMSEFLNRVPGCYFFIGSSNPDRSLDYPHHHPRFDFDEAALGVGIEMLTRTVETYLNEKS